MQAKKWIFPVLLSFSLALSGCFSQNSNESQALNDDDYAAILPHESTDTRVKHISLIQDFDVRIQVEKGLMDLSKQHFPPGQVAFKTHEFLDYDELDATDGSRGLLGTLRDDNPNGLNPSYNEKFDTGNGIVQGGIILVDLYELDWYRRDKLDGISIGLVVNDQIDYENNTYTITDEKMKSYIEVTCSKLVNYMRERFNEVSKEVPIYIAVYEVNHGNSTDSNGGYMYEGLFNGNQHSYKEIDENYVIIPSVTFTTMDPEMSDEFNEFKKGITTVLPDSTYVVGEGKFENGTLKYVTFKVTTHGKMMGEILSATQTVKKYVELFENTECDYRVQVINNGEVFAVMHRQMGNKHCDIITTI